MLKWSLGGLAGVHDEDINSVTLFLSGWHRSTQPYFCMGCGHSPCKSMATPGNPAAHVAAGTEQAPTPALASPPLAGAGGRAGPRAGPHAAKLRMPARSSSRPRARASALPTRQRAYAPPALPADPRTDYFNFSNQVSIEVWPKRFCCCYINYWYCCYSFIAKISIMKKGFWN